MKRIVLISLFVLIAFFVSIILHEVLFFRPSDKTYMKMISEDFDLYDVIDSLRITGKDMVASRDYSYYAEAYIVDFDKFNESLLDSEYAIRDSAKKNTILRYLKAYENVLKWCESMLDSAQSGGVVYLHTFGNQEKGNYKFSVMVVDEKEKVLQYFKLE